MSHNRTWEQIRTKPHIYKYNSDLWAVDYLLGRQSRIRTLLYSRIQDAVKQVNYVSFKNSRFWQG